MQAQKIFSFEIFFTGNLVKTYKWYIHRTFFIFFTTFSVTFYRIAWRNKLVWLMNLLLRMSFCLKECSVVFSFRSNIVLFFVWFLALVNKILLCEFVFCCFIIIEVCNKMVITLNRNHIQSFQHVPVLFLIWMYINILYRDVTLNTFLIWNVIAICGF